MDTVKLPENRTHGFKNIAAWAGEHPLLCAAMFFIFAAAARLLCNSLLGPIVIAARPDEYRTLHIARSIADGGPLMVRGVLTDFQKILYPLLISPAFLLSGDPMTQIKLVGVINCLAMASMVFPLALLARRLTPKPGALLFTLAFAVLMPDFRFTATFMSEVLYFPLSVWVFYFFHRAMAEGVPRKRLLLFALFGFITYLAYLTKETGAAYLIAAAAVLAVEGLRDRRRLKQNALALLVYACAFSAAFLIVKLALFRNMGNSYSSTQLYPEQLSLSVLADPKVIPFAIYSAASLLLAAILSFYVIPIFVPLFGTMNEEKRRMYLFSALSLVVTVGAIVYTVSIREDLGERTPRLFMRYLAPIALPFMILCFDFLLSKDKAKRKKRPGKQQVFILMAVFGTLLMLLLPTVPEWNSSFNHSSLAVLNLAALLLHLGMAPAAANQIWLAYKLFMLGLMVVGTLLLLGGKKKSVLAVLLCAVFAVSVPDNIMSYQVVRTRTDWYYFFPDHPDIGQAEPGRYVSGAMDILFARELTGDSERTAKAAVAVSDYIQRLDDAAYNGVMACMALYGVNYIETYIPQTLFITYILPGQIQDYLDDGAGTVWFDDFKRQYFVILEDYNPFTNVEVVYERAPYVVLRNLDPATMRLKRQD